MFTLKFFSNSDRRSIADARGGILADDPLLHPDLARMSLDELADLPLMPEHLGRPPVQLGGVNLCPQRN